MERQPVTSSNIRSAGYNHTTEHMDVEFNSGSVYRYLKVDLETYAGFENADSKGKFFGAFIKGNFEFIKLAGPGGEILEIKKEIVTDENKQPEV